MFDLNEIEQHGLRAGDGGESGREEQQHQDPEEEEILEQAAPTPALGSMKLSSDQRMLACAIDVDGSDRFVLAVFDLLGGGAAGGETARARRGGSTQEQGQEQGTPTAVTVLREDAM